MRKNLVRPGLSALEGGVDEYVAGWAHPYATEPFSPFWYADGGEDDDEGEEPDESQEDEEDEGEEEEDEDAGKTAEQLADELKRLRAAHIRKIRQGKNRSARIQELEASSAGYDAKIAELETALQSLREESGKSGQQDEAAQKRIAELIANAKEEGKNSFKPTVIRMAAKAELMSAGAQPRAVDRLVRMIDVNDADIDEETGEIDVSDQVSALKKDLPELFGERRAPRSVKKAKPGTGTKAADAGGAGGGDEGAGEVTKTATQRAADRLRGIKS